ncbi:MAG TPA: response regulator [Burkholderiales bacterium]|nr:response regulator [Burkholderiales bacterium]
MRPDEQVRNQELEPQDDGTVLIVDDERDKLIITKHPLEKAGIHCLTASSGRECVAVAQRQQVDLILLDLLMPGMDGWDTFAALQANATTKDIPVIMLTCVEGWGVRTRAMREGVSQFLTRPVPRERLLACVRSQLQGIRTKQRLESLLRSIPA